VCSFSFDVEKSARANRTRFDDTNPDAEEEEYFLAIEEIVRWLGRAFHIVSMRIALIPLQDSALTLSPTRVTTSRGCTISPKS
jgi:hypothetical protein